MLAGLGLSVLAVFVMLLGVAVVRDYRGLTAWTTRAALGWTGSTVDKGSTKYHVNYRLNRAGGIIVIIGALVLLEHGFNTMFGL